MPKPSIQAKKPNENHKKRAYSMTWALNVVENYENQHARAAEIALSVWGIDERMLASFLAFGDPFWRIFKYMVAWLERDLFFEVLPDEYARAAARSVLSDLLSGSWDALSDFQRKRYVERLTNRLREL